MKIDEVLSFRHLDLFTDQEKVTLEFAEMLNSIKDFKINKSKCLKLNTSSIFICVTPNSFNSFLWISTQ
jgi:hypothetical protein